MPVSLRSRLFRHCVIALVVICGGVATARADFLFNDFSAGPNLNLMNSASLVSNRLRLNPALTNQNGTAFYNDKQSMQSGFETQFRFEISSTGGSTDTDGRPGGDGFALIIQTQGATATGSPIAYIPYSIPDAFAIEFDTWRNQNLNDPSGNHISLQPVGSTPDLNTEYNHGSSLGSTSSLPNLSAGIHEALFRYTPGTLEVFVDDLINPVMTAPIDLTNVNGVNRLDPDGKAWIGFSGGTGASFENHDILDWSFTSIPEPSSAVALLTIGLAATFSRRRR